MRKLRASLLFIVLILSAIFTQHAYANGLTHFSETAKGTYQPLHPYTLNWSGDVLDRGGWNLTDGKAVTNPSMADLVINQYGAIGANAIIELGTDVSLQTPINAADYKGKWKNSFTMQPTTYLIKTHDNQLAKIRITEILPTKVYFEYAIETEAAPDPTEQWKELARQNNIATNKVWKVTFNKPFNLSTVTADNVFVLADDGQKMLATFKKGETDNILLVEPPVAGYEPGKSYTLYIKNTVQQQATNKPLKENVKMAFTIAQSSDPSPTVGESPKGLTAFAHDGTVSLDWYNIIDPTFLGYYLYMSEGDDQNFKRYTLPYGHALIVDDSEITISGLKNDIPYYFKVTALYSTGESAPSATVSLTPTTAVQTDYTGAWYTKYGTMIMTQTGNTVTGSYGGGIGQISGTIQGTVSGKTLSGTFEEPGNHGDILFVMAADGKSYKGSGRNALQTIWFDWSGVALE